QNEPMIAQIIDMRYSQVHNAIEYTLESNEMPIEKGYLAHEFVRLTQREQLRPRDEPAPKPKFLGKPDLPGLG
ncbi:MAG: hypothetical protein ACKOAH_07855, partial [Pirellula sp.]